jgi:hypothetical protein
MGLIQRQCSMDEEKEGVGKGLEMGSAKGAIANKPGT